MYRIDKISKDDYAKYKNRSIMAINGLKEILPQAEDIANMKNIRMKYLFIAQSIGLRMENPNSAYNFFIPLNGKIVFLLRMSNHNNTNPSLYNMHEKMGRPNKRYVIFFKRDNIINDSSSTFLDAEHHTVAYNLYALDNKASVSAFINSLINLFKNGGTIFPSLPITNNNNSIKTENYMRNNKRTIRLTESDLHRVIKESVRRMVNEEYPYQVSTEYIISTYRDRFEQARELMKQVVQLTKVDVHELEAMNGGNDDIQYCMPSTVEAIKDAYGRLYSLVNEMEEYNEDPQNESEDWHERNEHGDFDTY